MERLEGVEAEWINRVVVPGDCVRTAAEAPQVPIPTHGPKGEPQIEVIREGGVIQAIDVVCTCGRRIRLRCVY